MPELTVEERDDLIPSCCRGGCVVEVVAGVHNGVPAYWVQHGTESRAVTTGAEALEMLARLHELHIAQRIREELARLGKQPGDRLTPEEAEQFDRAMGNLTGIVMDGTLDTPTGTAADGTVEDIDATPV